MAIRIRCKQPGFRRAGIAHPADRTWPAGLIPDAVLEILKAEPMLIVEEVADPVVGQDAILPLVRIEGELLAGQLLGGAALASILEAQPAADAEGQQAEPEPGADALPSDTGATASEAATVADQPASETGEAAGADPAAAPEAAPPKRARKA